MKTITLILLLFISFSTSLKSFAENLSEKEKQGLKLMREEEKLAHDVYQFLYQKWQIPVFTNIATSEMRHFEAVGYLLDNYKVDDPAIFEEGMFTSLEIENLYDSLTQAGSKSMLAAFEVGAFIEELDIQDLQNLLLESKNEAINVVYENLLRGSRNHLRAFTRQLENGGINYKPKVLLPENYTTSVNSLHERGKGNASCFNTGNSFGSGRKAGNRFRYRGMRR